LAELMSHVEQLPCYRGPNIIHTQSLRKITFRRQFLPIAAKVAFLFERWKKIVSLNRVARFLLVQHTKIGKMIPNDRKIHQWHKIYIGTKIFNPKPFS
jgi:hypothetical protein